MISKEKYNCLVKEISKLESIIHELQYEKRIRQEFDDNAVWFWQGDDEDHLESLCCPVVINAYELRNLLK